MMFPSRDIVNRIREEYPAGTRVELVRMDDFQAPIIGTKGTVIGVDDTASIMVAWENGSSLHVIYGEDALRTKRLEAMTEKAESEGLKMRIREMKDFLENQTDRISEYDEQLVRKMIEKITIYDDKFVIEFKSGTSLDVRR